MPRLPFAQSLLLAGLVALGAGCSSSSNSDSGQGGGNGVPTTGATGSGAGGSGAAASTTGGAPIIDTYGGTNTGASSATGGLSATGGTWTLASACPGIAYDPDAGTAGGGGACAGTEREVESSKLDIYIMMDRTQSMDYGSQCDANDACASTRWADLTAAVQAFVEDPQVLAQGVRAGIQFFSQTGGYNNNATDCNSDVYATPAVEIAPLADNGPLIMQAIANTFPSGETPSVPALQGAIQHAYDWQVANPIRQTVVLLVTDGLPTMCDQTDAAFTGAAAAGMALDPPIRTYIVAVSVGANKFTLNSVAKYGGSTEAFLVDNTQPSDLVNALKRVTANPLPCEYTIPSNPNPREAIDYGKVQVLHTPATGPTEEVPYTIRRGGCGTANGGWYYDVVPTDDPLAAKPSKILLCPCSCASMDVGTIEIFYGCQPTPGGVN
jgi:hypothetical protein